MPVEIDAILDLLNQDKLVYELFPNPDGTCGVTFRDHVHVLMIDSTCVVAHPSIIEQMTNGRPDLTIQLDNPDGLKHLRRYLRAKKPTKRSDDELE